MIGPRCRVLHVVGHMDRGGTETWLMHVQRNIDHNRFENHFLVHGNQPGYYDEEIREYGGSVISCPLHRLPLGYGRALRDIIRSCGPYDILHAHVHAFSGLVVKAGAKAGIPIRIVHSHSDTRLIDRSCGLTRKAVLELAQYWTRKYATHRIAASRFASAALFGREDVADILHCAIDLAPFRKHCDPLKVRSELGIPGDAVVLGHVGRFVTAKNHKFLVRIAHEVMRREPKAVLLLIGDGSLRQQAEAEAQSLGIREKVIFAGARSDIPRLLLGAMDVFVFPSLWEGLPLSLLEAQAAGVPAIISDSITTEADEVKFLIGRLRVGAEAPEWATRIIDAVHRNKVLRQVALAQMEGSVFNINNAVNLLQDYYQRAINQAHKPCHS
jgi:glycosyltransferase involved in cell wall biosynthesis